MLQLRHKIKKELNEELFNILNYWSDNTIDPKNGGFYGRINHQNKVVAEAPKGIILNTRILWSFSAAGNYTNKGKFRFECDRAFDYLNNCFLDKTYGGVYWELDHTGHVINHRKQIYAQAFAVYACSEYFLYSQRAESRDLAIKFFELIENHSKDLKNGGYFEAFSENWGKLEDMRLSPKDMNASKTMNTHLHILEAYTSLSRCFESLELKLALKSLIELFLNTFLNKNNHYDLFFNDDWRLLSDTVSFGHDIETSWLLIEAAKQVGDKELLKTCQQSAIKVANTFIAEGIDPMNAVINEKNLLTDIVDTDRHWWPQVEAMIGLSYVYNLNNNAQLLEKVNDIWEFTKQYLIDRVHGEWYFRVDNQGKVYEQEDKVSMWKAPYHSCRACIVLNNIL